MLHIHIHPDEASFSAVLRSMHLPSSSSLRGHKSPVDELYLRLMFQQEPEETEPQRGISSNSQCLNFRAGKCKYLRNNSIHPFSRTA